MFNGDADVNGNIDVIRSKTRYFIAIVFLSLVSHVSSFADSSKLDALFINLKFAENETEAITIKRKIWRSWMKSGDLELDSLLQRALRKRNAYDFEGALIILDEIITINPNFPEAWNQRATLHFLRHEYEKSLIDIAKTLELEPRHFGSLAGRAIIRMRQSKPLLARKNIIKAMKYHPFLKERNMFPGLNKT